MNTADATRLAGDAYNTRRARDVAAISDDKTRLAQQGYQSMLAGDGAVLQPDVNEFYKVGDKIGGRYEVSAIHHGAMGVVYGCFDHQTKLPRALKTIRARYASDQQVLSMFESEATVWVSLEKHPYTVRAYLVERFQNLPYVITEYVRGPEGMEGDLRGWLGHPRLTLPVAVAMALQIAQGMQHAVRKVPNLVHRDLKPANILVNGDGKAMVTDFGLVQATQSDAGTPAYMSPEQWRAEALDARSDIYSYGCILFEMFTAHRLFHALTESDWERAHLESGPSPLGDLVPAIPSEIDRYIRHCLEKKILARPQSWDEVVMFFAEWHHRLSGKSVVLDFSSLALDAAELLTASYSFNQLKRYEDAIRACERALAIDQKSWSAWSSKSFSLFNLNRNRESIVACEKAIAINPNDAKTWSYKGIALYGLGLYAEATQANDRALELDSQDPSFMLAKGNILYKLKRYDEAVRAYDNASIIDSNYFYATWIKGKLLFELNRHDEAAQAFSQALVIDPRNTDAWISKGNALYRLNRYDDAILAWNGALAIDPIALNAWHNKATALLFLKKYEEAIQAYDRVLALDSKFFGAWYNKGLALSYLQRHREAIQALDYSLALDSKHLGALQAKESAIIAMKSADRPVSSWKRFWS